MVCGSPIPSPVLISQMLRSHEDTWNKVSNQPAEVEKLNVLVAVFLFSAEVRLVIGVLSPPPKKEKKSHEGQEIEVWSKF